jgi:hypothetical protein
LWYGWSHCYTLLWLVVGSFILKQIPYICFHYHIPYVKLLSCTSTNTVEQIFICSNKCTFFIITQILVSIIKAFKTLKNSYMFRSQLIIFRESPGPC